MSQVPRPQTRTPSSPSVTQDGTLAAIGTVSRCPATTTRSARPSSVRATTTLPSRETVQVVVPREGPLDLVGDAGLVAADRLDVDQRAQQRDQVTFEVQPVRHARHPIRRAIAIGRDGR